MIDGGRPYTKGVASNRLVTYPMGGNWYIINDYVPAIGVIHVMIFARLLRARALLT